MLVKVKSYVSVKNKTYKPGSEIELSDKQIKQLKDKGVEVETVAKPKGAK